MVFWIFALIFAALISAAVGFLGYVQSHGAIYGARTLFFVFLGVLGVILVLAAQRSGQG
jgi:hypothetical protein